MHPLDFARQKEALKTEGLRPGANLPLDITVGQKEALKTEGLRRCHLLEARNLKLSERSPENRGIKTSRDVMVAVSGYVCWRLRKTAQIWWQ